MRLQLRGFMAHDRSVIDFPDHGIVLVTGPNGHGKSTLVEAVAFAQFGKTVRGTSPWRLDGWKPNRAAEPGELVLDGARFHIRREHSAAGKNEVSFSVDGEPVAYENVTKAQEAITAVVGDFDVWRRACVFSSHDAAHFTLATDSERKRLLEAAVGLTVFDDALDRCRRDLLIASTRKHEADARVAQLTERVAGVRARLSDAEKVLAEAPPAADVPGLETKRAKADQLLYETDQEIKKAREPIAAAQQDVARITAEIVAEERAVEREKTNRAAQADSEARALAASKREEAALRSRVADLEQAAATVRAGKCPVCGASVQKPGVLAEYEASIAAANASLAQLKVSVPARLPGDGRMPPRQAASVTLLRADLEDARARAASPGEVPELEKDREEILQRRAALAAQLDAAREVARRRELAESAVTQGRKAVAETTGELVAAEGAVSVNARRVGVLEAVTQVLGTRGVRAQILSGALRSMEAVANLWLARVAGPGLRLRMKSFTEKKTGGVSDAISLEVEGAGGGLGYRASSGGERRRLDIAITLALSEVAAASRGEAPGLIFLDELLDCLDAEGTAAALSAVRALGETRCVVLITHSEDVLAQLTPTMRLRVEDGRVTTS